MQARRPQGAVSPLAIVLAHPPLPRRRSSLLSVNSSPRTPRSCGSPNYSSIFLPTTNRKSTDSWNSSNGPDDLEWDWKPEQTLLLSRTLDALPAHLVTPFNGPIPPSNLLDKIARGVSQAKGPIDWPHSIRATRVKLIELARLRAKEDNSQNRRTIHEEADDVEIEDGSNYSYYASGSDLLQSSTNISITQKGVGIAVRRPLYRQSSMDFMNAAGSDLKDNDNITRLSNRLQRTDRNPPYHPYSRAPRTPLSRRSSSPPLPANVPSLINPSTPSSSTLSSLISAAAAANKRTLRRSSSTLSSTSSSMSIISSNSGGGPASAYPYLLPAMASDPRVQRIRRTDSFCGAPLPPPKDTGPVSTSGFKRAPSFGALIQEEREKNNILIRDSHIGNNASSSPHARTPSGSYPSSDEEEKMRTKQAKKPRMKTVGTPPPVSSSPAAFSAASSTPAPMQEKEKSSLRKTKKSAVCLEPGAGKPVSTSRSGKSKSKHQGSTNFPALDSPLPPRQPTGRPRMNLQRNPSMFGAELPHLNTQRGNRDMGSPLPPSSPPTWEGESPSIPAYSPRPLYPTTSTGTVSSPVGTPRTPSTPAPAQMKTLRRVRRLAPARRISFGSLVSPGEGGSNGHGADGEGERERQRELGSAFVLV